MRLPADKTHRFILAAVLCGIALALSLIDTAVSSLIPVLPGFKLGLANIVSLFALYALGLPYALMICVVRSLITALLSGNLTMLFFSLAGGIASILVMRLLQYRLSVVKVSVCGGVTHNLLQVAAAAIITTTPQVSYYLPALIVAGAISGFAMGLICTLLFRRMHIPTTHKKEPSI